MKVPLSWLRELVTFDVPHLASDGLRRVGLTVRFRRMG